jgi:hypothetical protein
MPLLKEVVFAPVSHLFARKVTTEEKNVPQQSEVVIHLRLAIAVQLFRDLYGTSCRGLRRSQIAMYKLAGGDHIQDVFQSLVWTFMERTCARS